MFHTPTKILDRGYIEEINHQHDELTFVSKLPLQIIKLS